MNSAVDLVIFLLVAAAAVVAACGGRTADQPNVVTISDRSINRMDGMADFSISITKSLHCKSTLSFSMSLTSGIDACLLGRPQKVLRFTVSRFGGAEEVR